MTGTERQRQEMLRRLRRLADRRVNDAVKLAFLDAERVEQVEELDLSGLVELKKTDKGFEARFVDPIKVLEMMGALMEKEDAAESAKGFFEAMGGGEA